MSRRRAQWIGAGVLGLLGISVLGYFVWPAPPPFAIEAEIVRIPLRGPVAAPTAEISSLAFYGDTLVLLPQYPAAHGAQVFAIGRAAIEAVIDGEDSEAIDAWAVPFECPDLTEDLPGFDGFEAIAFAGDRFFVTVETHPDATQGVGFLLGGEVIREDGRLSRLVLDTERRVALAGQTPLDNLGYEALAVSSDRVIALYEANGQLNPEPRALVFSHDLVRLAELPMSDLEYRVTDATAIGSDGRFWVANYHWPGAPWQSGVCALTEEHGRGESHSRCATVERLVELAWTESGVAPTRHPPIQLALVDDAHPRNWEGIVRLDDRGFLVVTDEYPETILAFVATP